MYSCTILTSALLTTFCVWWCLEWVSGEHKRSVLTQIWGNSIYFAVNIFITPASLNMHSSYIYVFELYIYICVYIFLIAQWFGDCIRPTWSECAGVPLQPVRRLGAVLQRRDSFDPPECAARSQVRDKVSTLRQVWGKRKQRQSYIRIPQSQAASSNQRRLGAVTWQSTSSNMEASHALWRKLELWKIFGLLRRPTLEEVHQQGVPWTNS